MSRHVSIPLELWKGIFCLIHDNILFSFHRLSGLVSIPVKIPNGSFSLIHRDMLFWFYRLSGHIKWNLIWSTTIYYSQFIDFAVRCQLLWTYQMESYLIHGDILFLFHKLFGHVFIHMEISNRSFLTDPQRYAILIHKSFGPVSITMEISNGILFDPRRHAILIS